MMFGRPWAAIECPEYIMAGLRWLGEEIKRVEGNRTQKPYDSPTGNVAGEYKTDVFEMRSYCWNEDSPEAELPNFKCGDFEARWYKYLGRGTSMNREIDANDFATMLDRCLASVRSLDRDEFEEEPCADCTPKS